MTDSTNTNQTDSNNSQKDETMTQTTDNTTNDTNSNQENDHMHLEDAHQIRELVTAINEQFKAEGMKLKDVAPELYNTLGNLFWLCTLHKSNGKKHNNGRLFFMRDIGYQNANDDKTPSLWAYINCQDVVNLSVRVEERDDTLVPQMGRPIYPRNRDEQVVNLLKSKRSFSALSLLDHGLDALQLFQTKKAQTPFLENLMALKQLALQVGGAKALIFHKETGTLVAQIGVRTWVYPAVLDLLDPVVLHITYQKTDVRNQQVVLGGPTLWEYFGNSLEDTPQKEEPNYQMTEEDEQQFADC